MSAVVDAIPTEDMRLGLYPGMSNEDYHRSPGISCSGMHEFRRKPSRYWSLYLNPERPPRKEKAGQLEGTLCHCAALEPDEFDFRYVVTPEGAPARPTERSRKAKKPSADTQYALEWWDAFEEMNPKRRVITQEQYDRAWHQADSIRKLPDVAAAFAAGAPEVAAFWRDPQTGVLCRCKPDWVQKCGGRSVVLFDVKTYDNVEDEAFAAQISRKYYDWQDAMYSDGYAHAAGVTVEGFVFIAVEPEYPWEANLLMLDAPSREHAARQFHERLEQYAWCLEHNVWPGYSEIKEVSLSRWRLRDY